MEKNAGDVIAAFVARKSLNAPKYNTMTDGTMLAFHGSKIAWWGDDRSVAMTLAGWPTNTTRDRLNVLCRHLDLALFSQRGGKQYYDDREIAPDQVITVHLIS